MLAKLHTKLGDFWWYSIMLFCACRAADVLNAFVGLWLVPKYIDPSELGAVMPLVTFSNFLALPVSVFAMTFMKEMTALATRGDYGKMKSLIRGVFIAAGIFAIMTLVISRFVLPVFFERIRIEEGSLGLLILAASLSAAVTPVYLNALQALKRFKTISLLNIASAPIRFLVMVIAMPFRALSGYFDGQTVTSAFTISASVYALRKELSVPAEPYWTRTVFRRFAAISIGIASVMGFSAILGLVEQTVLRQRLPEIESAAYYMATRFSDIAGFASGTLIAVLFPFTATLATEGKATRPLVIKSSIAMIAVGCALAAIFAIAGRPLLAILPYGNQYTNYAWAIPWLIIITTLSSLQSFHANTEISAGRFGFLKWWIPLHLIFASALLFTTGFGYFTTYLPATCTDFLSAHNFTSLNAMLWWFTVTALIKTAICIFELLRQ